VLQFFPGALLSLFTVSALHDVLGSYQVASLSSVVCAMLSGKQSRNYTIMTQEKTLICRDKKSQFFRYVYSRSSN
jgi:hypothetical protein